MGLPTEQAILLMFATLAVGMVSCELIYRLANYINKRYRSLQEEGR